MGDASRKWTKFGRYALLEKIGSGGMAEIYRAKTFGAAGFEKEYAIKLIIPSLVDDTEFVDMFINEAKIVVNLYHANIVQVFDLGEIDDQYYIAMEFVHGKDLLDILARCAEQGIKIPLNLVLFVTMEMLKGLNFAHQAKDPFGEDLNIIHRDISPSNIMISYAGDVKVGDFGVAKAAIQRSLSDSDTLKGKVGYMSPEQVMGEQIDHRSDIFSAGIVFFEALSMSRLFVGNSDLDVMLKVRDADIDAAMQRMGPMPGELDRIVRRALARHPEDRFQTAGDFYQELVDFCFQHGIKVTGNDLSNLMRRLFEAEIEEEKTRRRQDPKTAPPEILAESQPGSILSNESSDELADEETEQSPHQPGPPSQPARQAPSASSSSASSSSASSSSGRSEEPSTVPNAAQARAEDIQTRQSVGGADGSTVEVDDDLYRFRSADGQIRGPMDYDEIVQLFRHRIPNPDDRISVANGPWKRPTDVQALQDSIPDYSDVFEDTDRNVPVGARVFRRGGKDQDTEKVEEKVDRSNTAGGHSHGVGIEETDLERSNAKTDRTPHPPGSQRSQHSGGRSTDRIQFDRTQSDSAPGQRNDTRRHVRRPSSDSDELEATVRAMEEMNMAASKMGDADEKKDDQSHGSESGPGDKSPVPQTDQADAGSALGSSSDGVDEDEDLDELREQYASYEGNLSETPFPRLLGRLHLADATGRLHVQHGSVEKSIYFRKGEPVLVDSSKEEELLGSFLLSRGLIDEQQLNQALARLHEWGGRLGDALVAIGAVPAHDIYELLSEQMREKLLDIFTWRRGFYGYFENQEPDTKGYPMGIDALQIVVEGCRNRVPFGHLVEFYQDRMTTNIHRKENAPLDVDRLRLSTRELRVLNQISQNVTVSRLVDAFPSTQKSRVYRMVYLLHQLEIVSFEDSVSRPLPDL